MKCPQCGVETPDEQWNCISCRINLYWAVQHYNELAHIRERQGLADGASSATFLIDAHKQAMGERAATNRLVDNRVRALARKVMRQKSTASEPDAQAR